MTSETSERFKFTAFKLSAFLAIVFLIQIITDFNPGFRPGESPVINFFTAIFGHSNLQHLIGNLFFIVLFGSIYEKYTSRKLFLTTFLVSGWIANLTSFVFFQDSFIIGASGGAMGILAALAVYRPKQLGIGLGVPMPMWAVLISYIFLDLAGITGANNIANEAHLLGMFTGIIIGYRLRNQPILDFAESYDEEENSWEEKISKWERKYMLNKD